MDNFDQSEIDVTVTVRLHYACARTVHLDVHCEYIA